MVENAKTCILQSIDHAKCISKHFTKPWTRQALVSVTFFCEGKRLCNYKLMLAPSSIYFEVKALSIKSEAIIYSLARNFRTSMDTEYCESEIIIKPCDELDQDEHVLLDNSSNSNMHFSENQYSENNENTKSSREKSEHMLYGDSQDFEFHVEQNNTLFSIANSKMLIENNNSNLLKDNKVTSAKIQCSEKRIINSDTLWTSNEVKPTLYEQCCDYSDIDDCEESSISLSQSCLEQIEKDFAQYKFDGTDVPSKVGKCVKVYTHKRRKSIDEIRSKLTDVNDVIQSPSSSDCIDLLDVPSTDNVPVTLLTSLDMESAEYIISLSTENIQSIVGATLPEQQTLSTCKEIEQIFQYHTRQDGKSKIESSNANTKISNGTKPVLRRSLRLNQQEVEETANNNNTVKEPSGKERHINKSSSLNRTDSYVKKKRKIKKLNRMVIGQSIDNVMQQSRKALNSSRRNTAKLIVKRNNKCTISDKGKDKIANKIKCNISEATEIDSIFTFPKLNTIEYISRALWGDMSDFSENCENRINTLDYTPNAEIPFAVGLLPLRTALEKMQATPDHQPRKTRSSLAPTRQDVSYFKRKDITHFGKITNSKKQSICISDPKENAKAVCHIQIRAASTQYVRNRKKYLTQADTLEPLTVLNKY